MPKFTAEDYKQAAQEYATSLKRDSDRALAIRQSAVANGNWPVKPTEDSTDNKHASVQSAVDKTMGTMFLPIATVNVDASGNKGNAQADYEDARRRLWAYQNDPQAQAAAKEKENAYNQALQEGATGTGAVYQDETLARLQQEAKNAEKVYESEKTAAHDQNIYNQDMADISGLSQEELEQLQAYADVRGQGKTGNPITDLFYLPVQKKKAAGGLMDKYGEQRLNELAETYSRSLAQQQKEQVEQAAQRDSDGILGGALTTAAGIAASPVSAFMGAKGRMDEWGDSSGRYNTLQSFTPGDTFNVYTDAAKQNVTQQIAGDGSNPLRQGAALLYQVGTGAAQSAFNAIVLGPAVGAATSAMGSYTRTLADATERGATAAQANLLASSTAALDFVMDKIPLDRLFSLASSGSASALKAALKQAGIEMTTEGTSFLGSQLLEMSILQQNSQYAQSIQAYRAQGLSQDDAVLAANKDLLSQAGQQLLVAGLSGGISAGVSTAVGNHRQKKLDALADAERQRTQEQAPDADASRNPAAAQPAPGTQPPESTIPPDQPPLSNASAPDQPTAESPETQAARQQAEADRIAQIRAAQQERDIQKEADRIDYQDAKSRAKARKELEKELAKTQADVDAGKGSPARLRRIQSELAQMDLQESDYPRTRQEAIQQQTAIVDSLQEEQHAAYIRRETGNASNRPNKVATNRLKAAKQELDRLRGMSDADYANELAELGLPGPTRAPWLDGASAALAAQETIDQILAASGGRAQSYNPESVSDISEASDFLRGRLDQRTQDYNERIAAIQQSAQGTAQQQPPDPLETVSRMAQENAQKTQRQKQQSRQAVQDQVEHMTGGTEGPGTQQSQDQSAQPEPGTAGKQSEPSGDTKKSATFTNSGLHSSDEDVRSGYRETLKQDTTAGDYQQKHNADVYSVARERTATPEKVNAEYDYIMNKTGPLTAEDGVTGRLVAKQLFKDGDTKRLVEMNKRLAREATNAGQFNQAFSITGKMRDASDPLSAADSATARISGMSQKDSKYPGAKSGLTYEAWQDKVSGKISGLAMEVDRVKDGDTAAMKNVITKIAKERNTTAFFGTSNRLTKSAASVLDKLDFEDLKKIANTQIASMPDDYRKRGKMEIVSGIRKQSMLSSLKTFERNLAGNGAVGLLDSASDSFGGRLADMVLSKITGKRTIGNDLARAGTYMKSAADAGRFASLCVELNVPIETDANASFDAAVSANHSGKYIGKTFSATGNPVMRALYAYQKYMSYALEVSDKIFEGGTSGATEASLRRLKNSGLSDEEVSRLSDYTAHRRTFKDATWTDEQGRTRGSDLSRTTQSFKNIAKGKGGIVEPVVNAAMDTAIPFASVPMNVTQTGTDYTVGVFKGLAEMAKIAHDAKNGVNIPVERQRQAASDFGRGLTGAALISLAAAAAAKGIIQVHDNSDKNKKALDQSQGLSGSQINWTAMSRAAEGGDETWKSGDLVTSLDFLEPFNTHMYLGVELANAESGMDYVKAPLASVFSSFMDSPMNDGLNQITELISDAVTAAESGSMADIGNAVAEYGGNVASSFIPQSVRQAAQATDGFYRDTRGENSAEYAANSIKSAVPGLSETLPKKMDGFGNEQKRPGALSTFLDPTNTKRINLYSSAEYLDELSDRTGDKSVYPDRQAPMTAKNAIGEEVTLTPAQRETYQKTYGDKVSDYYGRLRLSKDFSALSDELKTDALNQVKDYAAQFARASVTDFKGTPEGSAKEIVDAVVSQVTKRKMSSTMDDISDAWEHGYSTQKNSALLDTLYRDMQKLSQDAKDRVLDSATGQTKTYLEARTQGLPSSTALSILRQVQSLPKEDRNKQSSQFSSVASTKGLTEEQWDIAMKLYMKDYDPSDKSPDASEPRYDYIRKELGYSASDYASFKTAYAEADEKYGNGNGSVSKSEYLDAMEAAGYSKKAAEEIYLVLWGGNSSQGKALKAHILDLYG